MAPESSLRRPHQVPCLWRRGGCRSVELQPSPVVALHRAVAVAELEGPDTALAVVDQLPLNGYHLWHAVRADLLGRLGRHADARAAYDASIDHTRNDAERRHLASRRQALASGP